MTKTWGFSVPSGPLQFSTNGWRINARSTLEPSDLVVIVGTKGAETDEDEQGRILGLMEPTRHVASSLDYDLIRGPQDLDSAGNYKWPSGLELVRAWRFDDPRPLLTDITTRRFHMDTAQGIVRLEPDEADSILALPRTEVGLLSAIAARARWTGRCGATQSGAGPDHQANRHHAHAAGAGAHLCGDAGYRWALKSSS